MTTKEQALGQVSYEARLMYAVLEETGPQVTKFFQQDRVLADGRRWKWSRADYPTKPRIELEAEGLIRSRKQQHLARIYEITPDSQIAPQAARYKREKTAKHRHQLGRPLEGEAGRIAEYRRIENALGTKSQSRWIEARRRVVELAGLLRRMCADGMIFWKHVPADELVTVYEEVLSMKSWAEEILASCDLMRGDQDTRELIIKLRSTNGRRPEEIPQFLAKANELEAKLST
jgi:hypothetical protein